MLVVFDPSGTPAYGEQYSAPIEVKDLTNNASDRVFGVAINNNSTNIAVHGVETFFADSSLRLQGKFATFNSGAGIAFHPRNVDEETADLDGAGGVRCLWRLLDPDRRQLSATGCAVAFRFAATSMVRSAPSCPTPAERAADPTLVVKLFGLTSEGSGYD